MHAMGNMRGAKMTPADVLSDFEERAGILEYDAADVYPTRADAESAAWERMREKFGAKLAAQAFALRLKEARDV